MAETKMNVQLIAHTQVSRSFLDTFVPFADETDGQAVALTAIRTCYSANKPTEIVAKEGAKYFGSKASDGGAGTDADRLFRHIVRSGHSSTLEHISFTFAIEGVSRALLAQLTRHRVGFSFSVQSQRYVRMGSDDRSGGFDYVTPPTVAEDKKVDHSPSLDFTHYISAADHFSDAMEMLQDVYDELRSLGVPAEDARAVLPNSTATNLVMTANLTALLSFYSKRRSGKGAQKEISDLAEMLRREVESVEPWTSQFFEAAG